MNGMSPATNCHEKKNGTIHDNSGKGAGAKKLRVKLELATRKRAFGKWKNLRMKHKTFDTCE